MTTLSPTILLISFFLFSLPIKGDDVNSQNNLIQNTCGICAKNDPNINYTFCTSSLQAAAAGQCATLRGLGMISITLILNNATDTRSYIRRLTKHGKRSRYVRQCLADCFELYSDAIPDVRDAMKSSRYKQYDDANVKISAVMDAATTCEDGFKEGGSVSPLTERNNDVFQLSAIALSVMHQIQPGSVD